VALDPAASRGMIPFEMFGKLPFPTIGERPSVITLGPHGFYWPLLEKAPS
jgi:maltose alpha-D-glucosyltransferase/alpha-amylase